LVWVADRTAEAQVVNRRVATARLKPVSKDDFSIGETAAIVGVSTHVIRSWERRLSLDLNHRTRSNQRRYWIEDIQRFITIRRLHEASHLPLVESAARALDGREAGSPVETVGNQSEALDAFWAALSDTLPELLLVIDESGNVAAANESARVRLNVHRGSSFLRLAPGGWRRTYRSMCRQAGSRRQSVILAMRARTGIVFMDAKVVPVGPVPDGPVVLIGTRVRVKAVSGRAQGLSSPHV
jgi:DNA-binding transcriptional MerR regulator